jgi:hypothetical protein
MKIAFDIATAIVAATMAGNEFAIAAFVHPQLQRLDTKAHAQAASKLATALGKAMPLWYGLALALNRSSLRAHAHLSRPRIPDRNRSRPLGSNYYLHNNDARPHQQPNREARPTHPYAGWLEDRARWDSLHRIRVALLIVAVLLLFAGLFKGAAA